MEGEEREGGRGGRNQFRVSVYLSQKNCIVELAAEKAHIRAKSNW